MGNGSGYHHGTGCVDYHARAASNANRRANERATEQLDEIVHTVETLKRIAFVILAASLTDAGIGIRQLVASLTGASGA